MARTLVIKGADFATNKVTTVTIQNDIPCTGISFSQSTITITGTSTATITYTLTPNDTTDEVIWESSNTDIVTIADAVMTPVGVGTCTITATCGSYSASATVTVSMSYIADWDYGLTVYNSTNEIITVSSTYARIFTRGTGMQETEYLTASTPTRHVVKLPKNVGSIKISITDKTKFEASGDSQVIWAKDEPAGESNPYNIHALSAEEKYNIWTTNEKTYSVPAGVDSFAFTTRLKSSGSSEIDPNTLAAAGGLTIEFLPPAE